MDPSSLLQAFKRKGVALGVKFVKGEVGSVLREGQSATEVVTTEKVRYPCDMLLMATGRHSGVLAEALYGIPRETYVPVCPRKRYVHMIRCPRFDVTRSQAYLKGLEGQRPMSMTIDTSGVFWRPEGNGFICGNSPHGDEPDPDADFSDFEVGDVAQRNFEDVIWPAMASRVPAFEEAKLISTWTGHYDFNTKDHNAIIGTVPGSLNNVIWAYKKI